MAAAAPVGDPVTDLEPIAVRRHGSRGRTVVVLHGGPGAPGSAAGLARALADDFVVLEPLQRRSGRVPLTVARHVEDLAAVAPSPAVLVGHSWGAMLALSFASRQPERVSELVLVGCGTYDHAARAELQRSLARRQTEADRARIEALRASLAAERDPAARDAIFGAIGSATMRAESYELVDDPGDAADPVAPVPADEKGHLETWSDVLRLQAEGVEPAAFRAITARVLMLHGDVDPHPGPATRDLLRRFIPRLEYVGLERCGHEPWRERYARSPFLAALRRWLAAA
ncbi:MAG TPA: alpha/beta hydrolase [Candidatus Binatia bacterium]|nr:alpha/beta hydrolase [Candidatus Binatia bacterium]